MVILDNLFLQTHYPCIIYQTLLYYAEQKTRNQEKKIYAE